MIENLIYKPTWPELEYEAGRNIENLAFRFFSEASLESWEQSVAWSEMDCLILENLLYFLCNPRLHFSIWQRLKNFLFFKDRRDQIHRCHPEFLHPLSLMKPFCCFVPIRWVVSSWSSYLASGYRPLFHTNIKVNYKSLISLPFHLSHFPTL